MKRYDVGCNSITGGEWETAQGRYSRFEDVQQLAKDCLPFLHHDATCDFIVDELPCNCGYEALTARLKSIGEQP